VGVAIHCPNHGCPVVEIIVGVHVELGRHGALLPTVQWIAEGWGVGVAMHWPSQGLPEVELMVGVQVDLGRQGWSLPTVHEVTAGGVEVGHGEEGGGVGVAMHWPSHGLPEVEIMVGVQVDFGRHGLSFPTVQGVTPAGGTEVGVDVGGVGVAIHWPNHGWPLVLTIVGVHVELGRQGAS
jgi:hypothetical protein